MFTIINDLLFMSKLEELTNKDGLSYVKESISTIADDEGKNRKVLVVTAEDNETLNSIDSSAVIQTKEKISASGRANTNVHVRLNRDEQKYQQPVMVIAFPFNGIFVPQEESPYYRVYKAMVSTVKDKTKPFEFNGQKFLKIAYVVIGLNTNKLKNAGDSVMLTFRSYNYVKDENGEKATNRHDLQISVSNVAIDGLDDLRLEYNYEFIDEIVEPVNLDEITAGKPMFKVFTPKEKESRNHNNNHNRSNKNYANDNKKSSRDTRNNNAHKSFETMLKDYQNEFTSNQSSISSRNKKKSGKKGRR